MSERLDILRQIVSVPKDDPVARLRATLFPQQLATVDENAKRAARLCSRRAGKTSGIMRRQLIKRLSRPKSVGLYFATTLKAARKLVWDGPESIPFLIDSMHLPATYSNSEHRVDFFNGSKLWISGAEDEKDASRWLGVASDDDDIDEAQEFPDHVLRHLVFRVLSPSLMDRGGSLWMSGTPHPACFGMFYEATKEKNPTLKTHRWTWRDNPFLKDPAAWLAEECLQRGISNDDPEYQREFDGIWVREDSALIYRYSKELNSFEGEVPPTTGERCWVLGIDLGWEDATAFVLGTYDSHSPFFYVTDAFSKKHLLTDQIAQEIRDIQVRHTDMRIVMDCGGLGKTISEDLRQRYGLPIVAAQKTEKLAHQMNMNNDLRTGKIKIHISCKGLTDQMHLLRRDPATGQEVKNMPNDLCDANLYCHRMARAYQGRLPEPKTRTKNLNPDQLERFLLEQQLKYVKEQGKVEDDFEAGGQGGYYD
ncbi:MAG: hypothetical protein OK454_02635 [Thaumarchaeota archaeon]|nr:hypothetical protein [Nitrososphaerota archaeon]